MKQKLAQPDQDAAPFALSDDKQIDALLDNLFADMTWHKTRYGMLMSDSVFMVDGAKFYAELLCKHGITAKVLDAPKFMKPGEHDCILALKAQDVERFCNFFGISPRLCQRRIAGVAIDGVYARLNTLHAPAVDADKTSSRPLQRCSLTAGTRSFKLTRDDITFLRECGIEPPTSKNRGGQSR